MLGIKDGGTVKKVRATKRNPVARSLNQHHAKTIQNKKKEEEKKRLKSMKDLYRLEYLT